ncbi:RNA polymerase sigma factor [Chitinophagaceae bacterium LWZ2-11]
MNEVTALKTGDEKQFALVYDALHRKVFRFFLKRFNEHESAKELTQQTFIKLWQSRHTLSVLHTVDTQLFRMAASVLIDHIRKQASEDKLKTGLINNTGYRSFWVNEHPDKSFEHSDYINVITEQLPPLRKKIMRLRLVHGLTNKEIASQLYISVKTVEDHITKALRHVRSITSIVFILILLSALLS